MKAIFKSKFLTFFVLLSLLLSVTAVKGVKEGNHVDNLRKFIGTSVSCGPPFSLETGSCFVYCTQTFYLFWIPVNSVGNTYICGTQPQQ